MATRDPIKVAFRAGLLYRIDSACWWGKSSKVSPDEIDAPPDIMHGVKVLIDPKHLSELRAYKSKGERYLKQRAFPFLGLRGVYFVPKAFISSVDQMLTTIKEEFDFAVDAFLSNYEVYKEEWKKKSGRYYDENLYPTKSELMLRFRFDWSKFIISVPSPDNGLLSKKEYAQEVEKQRKLLQEFLDKSLGVLASQFYEILSGFEERLKSGKPIVGKTLKSIQTFVETFGPMNITGNKGLETLVKRFEKVVGGGLEAKDLNKDEELRTSVQKKITSIVESFKSTVEKDNRLKRSMEF